MTTLRTTPSLADGSAGRVPARLGRRIAELAGAVLVTVALVAVGVQGVAAVPPLGPTMNPGTGVWRLSPDASVAQSGTVTLPGLTKPATVTFESDGTAHLSTQTDADLWRVTGYVQAQFRLTQMDLARRRGEGALAAILGPQALHSDETELDLGLLRAAQRDWQQTTGDARTALLTFSAGVNAAVDQLADAHQLPTAFTLLDYRPAPWTPVDSLVIQLEEAQNLGFSDAALMYSGAATAMGPAFHTFFPDIPANPQQPYDPGPYPTSPLTPLDIGADPDAATPSGDIHPLSSAITPISSTGIEDLVNQLATLPRGEVHDFGASNAWVVSGAHTASGKPLLASDPHLDFSLPAIWFQMEASSPSYHFAGVAIPGTPVIVIGRTDSFSWGITDAQHPATLFYVERTDPSRPSQYYWDGEWRPMRQIGYTIAVKGQAPVHHTVSLTAQGPVMNLQGQTTAVWWSGTLPSQNIADILTMLRSHDFASVRASFHDWAAPALNIVYADQAGHIGAFGVGVAPQVAGHDITLPLPGDGSADVSGAIPYEALPNVYDPPSGYIVSANQREVSAAYPYEYSTSYNFADQGFRATEIVGRLSGAHNLTAADFQHMQTDQRDPAAAQLDTLLLNALAGQPLTATGQAVVAQLTGWEGQMTTDSVAATVAQEFAEHLVYVVFRPWWDHFAVPGDPKATLAPQPFDEAETTEPLLSTVLNWLQHDPTNRYLSPPAGPTRDAAAVLRQTFTETVAHLAAQDGPNPSAWRYGQHHQVAFPSLLQTSPLDRGPYPEGGDLRTVDAADGVVEPNGPDGTQIATGGPSWRFVMDWGSDTGATVYPGGQSENSLSPWYDNGIPQWRAGQLVPQLYGRSEMADNTSATWRLIG